MTFSAIFGKIKASVKEVPRWLGAKKLALLLLGAAILSFGLINIHRRTAEM